MKKTTNYGLNLPEENDFYNVDDMNANMEIIDREMKEAADAVQEEMSKLKKSVSDGKIAVASAITSMGVSTETDATFEQIAENIEKIKPTINVSGSTSAGVWNGATFTYGQGGGGGSASINGKNSVSGSYSFTAKTTTVGGNASASDVLSGKSFSSNNAGRAINGTMTNRGAWGETVYCQSTYGIPTHSNLEITIPAGYHNGSGKVKCKEGVDCHMFKVHTFGGTSNYAYLTITPENGYYYSISDVNGISEQIVFIALFGDGNCTQLLDVIPVLKSDVTTKYTGQSGDYRAWGNKNKYYLEKIASNKYASGKWVGVQILTMVAQG